MTTKDEALRAAQFLFRQGSDVSSNISEQYLNKIIAYLSQPETVVTKITKRRVVDILSGVCHSDPTTANGEYCITIDELMDFACAIRGAQP